MTGPPLALPVRTAARTVGGVLRRPSSTTPDPGEVHRISSAPRRHSDDLSQRMSRYLISMAVRTACVVLVVVVHGPLRWVFAVGAIGLPYVAVVMANTGRRPREPGVEAPNTIPIGSLTSGEQPSSEAAPSGPARIQDDPDIR